MSAAPSFYFCPVCFVASRVQDSCHEHEMVAISLRTADDRQRRPISDGKGRLLSRAPLWFLEATHPTVLPAPDYHPRDG
jgi:hypothetical protein